MPEKNNDHAKVINNKVNEQVIVFREFRDHFEDMKAVIVATLDDAAKKLPGAPIVHGRVKSIDSFAEKCIRKHDKYNNPAWQLTDLCGVRVIVLSKDAIPHVKKFIEDNFLIIEHEDTSGRLKEKEFGYQSVHYIVALNKEKMDSYKSAGVKNFDQLFKPRSVDEAKMESLPAGPVFKAEIQVRTLLQHAWSSAVHDNLYKTEMKKSPPHLVRESALISALLEDADDSIVSLINSVDEYRSYYGSYMTVEEIRNEIDIQRTVLAHDAENKSIVLKISRLCEALDDLSETNAVEKDLSMFEKMEDADIHRELGIARWKLGNKKIGRDNLKKSSVLNPNDPDTWCELGKTYFEEKNFFDAHDCYKKAYQINPDYPRALMRFIECMIRAGKDSSFDFIPLIRHNLEKAIVSSMHKIETGMHLPYAWYDIGFFNLLLGKKYESLEAYGKAVLTTSSADLVELIYVSLTEMQKMAQGKMPELITGMKWIRSFLRIVLVGRFKKSSVEFLENCDERIDDFSSLSPSKKSREENPFKPDDHIVIVAGSCSESSKEIISVYRPIICAAFKDFEGFVCSGGTENGVSGIVGSLDNPEGKILKRGYLPSEGRPMEKFICIQTVSGSFTALDPLMLWADILISGVPPENVRVLGVRGGEISAFEYQLALLLRAKVGLIPESGGSCRRTSEDSDWSHFAYQNGEKNCLFRLPADVETLKAFLNPTGPAKIIDPKSRENMAQALHEGYSKDARAGIFNTHKNIAPWEKLDDTFKKSNFALIDHIEEKLKRVKLSLRKVSKRSPALYLFDPDQLAALAEMEHGRWVVERLEDGWTLGERNDEKKIRPQLVAWSELPESEKEKDYNAIKRLPEMLADEGYEII